MGEVRSIAVISLKDRFLSCHFLAYTRPREQLTKLVKANNMADMS
jgi:hypothetical protein